MPPVDPGDISQRTEICPLVPSWKIPLLARVRFAAKLMALEFGNAAPAGKSRTLPDSVGLTAVRMTATALASAGTLQTPVTGNVLVVLAPNLGACACLVSTTRQGVSV